LSWSTRFEDPIELPNGKKLVTLKDAATYITGLPKKESALPEWQTAIEALLLCSRGGDPMVARIGVMKAQHRRLGRILAGPKSKIQFNGVGASADLHQLHVFGDLLVELSHVQHLGKSQRSHA
jgi:hypothetical protein